MATLTLTNVANAAARSIGVLDSGEGLSTQQKADALIYFNQMIAQFSLDQRMIPSLLVTSGLALVSGTQSYTIGAGGVFNITRPLAIVSANAKITTAGGAAYDATGDPQYAQAKAGSIVATPLKILTADEFAQFPNRDIGQVYPKGLFYDRAQITARGTIWILPTPLGAASTLQITTWQPWAQFADATTALTIPDDGYQELIQYGGAIRMCQEMNVPIPDGVMKLYDQAITRVATLNGQLVGAGGLQPASVQSPAGAQ